METIDVLCFIFPDGATMLLPTEEFNQHDPHQVMATWKAQLSPERREKYEKANVMGGFVWMHMLREEYDKLPATSLAYAITERLKEGA